MKTLENYKKVPIEKAVKPKDGYVVMADRWWIVVDECILFYRGYAPQCNDVKAITESIRDRMYPGAEVRFLPMVFRAQEPQ